MCGRFVQYSDPEIYAGQFDLDAICETARRYDVEPMQPVLGYPPGRSGRTRARPLELGPASGLVQGTGQPLEYDQRQGRDGQIQARLSHRLQAPTLPDSSRGLLFLPPERAHR
jgi:putative SOS response-associated peptidase YedK